MQIGAFRNRNTSIQKYEQEYLEIHLLCRTSGTEDLELVARLVDVLQAHLKTFLLFFYCLQLPVKLTNTSSLRILSNIPPFLFGIIVILVFLFVFQTSMQIFTFEISQQWTFLFIQCQRIVSLRLYFPACCIEITFSSTLLRICGRHRRYSPESESS